MTNEIVSHVRHNMKNLRFTFTHVDIHYRTLFVTRHSEERSDEESRLNQEILWSQPRFFAPYGRSE
jgi:hypothetical protein